MTTRTRLARLTVQPLEGRDVPASFGVPWSDPTHLTISFAPDGTTAAGLPSDLETRLDAQMPRDVWRGTILRAARTWADAGGLNIGVVADGGDPFGIAGGTQGDPRFGDIRFGGLAMTEEALGEAVPPDPVLTGTLAGDVFFNTAESFDEGRLLRVALHEIGHALGLPASADPRSVMFNQIGDATALTAADVRDLRALYGRRLTDPSEERNNDPLTRATRIDFPSSYDGETPLFAFGALTGRNDRDSYEFRVDNDSTGPVTVRLQTAGISLATPRLSVYDARRTLIDRVEMTGPEGGVVEYTLTNPEPGGRYYLRVEAGDRADALGRYGIAIVFEDLVRPGALTVEEVLRGPHDLLDQSDLAELYADPTGALYHADGGDDDNIDDAVRLDGEYWRKGFGRFRVIGSLTTAADVDFYEIRAPRSGRRVELALVAQVRALGPNGVAPTVAVFDRHEQPMPVKVLANGDGTYTVQAVGAESGRRFYLRVAGAGAGNYALEAAFRARPATVETFATGSVTAAAPADARLYVARTQLFGFALSATGPAGSAVRMTIRNEAGDLVFDRTAPAGATVTGLSTFLAPGAYEVRITAVGAESGRSGTRWRGRW